MHVPYTEPVLVAFRRPGGCTSCKKWYFVTKILLTAVRKNCSRPRICKKKLRSLEQFIQTVKGQNIFGNRMLFLICSWRFLRSNKLEQLEFKLEKIIGI